MLPPAGTRPATLRLDVLGGGTALSFAGLDGAVDRVTNPPAVAAHGALRAICDAGSSAVALPASTVFFTDGSGQDREIYLPAITLGVRRNRRPSGSPRAAGPSSTPPTATRRPFRCSSRP